MRVLLEIGGDASALKTVLAGVEGDIRKTQGTITGETRRGARERVSASQQESAEIKRLARDVMAGCAKGERERTKAADDERKKREAGERRETKVAEAEGKNRKKIDVEFNKLHYDLSQKLRNARAKDETDATKKAQQEAAKKAKLDADFNREKESISVQLRNARAAAEEEATRKADQEAKKRARIAKREADTQIREARRAVREARSSAHERATTIVSGTGQVVNAAQSYATQMAGSQQEALQRRAEIQHTLSAALNAVDATPEQIAHYTTDLQRYAAGHNLDPMEMARGIAESQERSNTLGDRNTEREHPGQVAANWNRLLQGMERGRSSNMGVQETALLRGTLSGLHFDAGRQDSLQNWIAGAAERGAVNANALSDPETKSAFTGVVQAAMEHARRTGGDAQSEGERAARDFFADLQVGAGMGKTPTESAHSIASLDQHLTSTATQRALFNNIQHSGGTREARTALLNRISEVDAHGNRHLREGHQEITALARDFEAEGIDAVTARNIVRGGGHGNRRSLLDNEGSALGFLLGRDAEGHSGLYYHDVLTDPSTTMSAQRIAQGQATLGNDPLSQMVGDAGRHDLELLGLASPDGGGSARGLAGMNVAYQRWSQRHPWASGLLGEGAGLAQQLAGWGGSALFTRWMVKRAVARVATQAATAAVADTAAAVAADTAATAAVGGTEAATLAAGGTEAATLAATVAPEAATLAAAPAAAGTLGAAGAGTIGAAVVGSALAGLAIGEGANRLIYAGERDRHNTSILQRGTWGDLGHQLFTGEGWGETWRALTGTQAGENHVRPPSFGPVTQPSSTAAATPPVIELGPRTLAALTARPVVAEVSPQAAEHAATRKAHVHHHGGSHR